MREAAATAAQHLKVAEAGPKLVDHFLAAPADLGDETYEAQYYLDAMAAIDPALVRGALDRAESEHLSSLIEQMKESKDAVGLSAAVDKTTGMQRAGIIEKLGYLDQPAAHAALVRALANRQIRLDAAAALANLATPEAAKPLLALLMDLEPGAEHSVRGLISDGMDETVDALEKTGDQGVIAKAKMYVQRMAKKAPEAHRARFAKLLERFD